MKRNRKIYFLLIILTILIGLFSRSEYIPEIIYPYLGDFLYTIIIFFIVGFVFIKMKSWKAALACVLFCCVIEFSQLYQSNWVESIRSNKLGGLILGNNFYWSDIVNYIVGGVIGYLIEDKLFRKSKKNIIITQM